MKQPPNTALRDDLKKILRRRKSIPIKGTEVYRDGEVVAMAFEDAELTEDEAVDQILKIIQDNQEPTLQEAVDGITEGIKAVSNQIEEEKTL